jgi:hypothetical protein
MTMSLTQFIIDSFAVFLIWAGVLYPLLSPWVGGIARPVIFALIVALIAYLVVTYDHPKLYFVLAVAGAVAVLQRWRDDCADGTPATAIVRAPQRVPPNGV